MFRLHPRLAEDCLRLGRFPLCHLLLMRDASYPWCILVPDREDVREIFQLSADDQAQLLRESSVLSSLLTERFQADKLNIAAIGNLVPQLHLHHVVRYRGDRAWPAPVWGRHAAEPYTEKGLAAVVEKICSGLPSDFVYAAEVLDGRDPEERPR